MSDMKSDDIRVMSSMRLDDVDIDGDIKVNGSLVVNGPVKCNDVVVLGKMSCDEDLTCETLRVNGSVTVMGDTIVNDYVKINGSTVVNGTLRVYGWTKINGKLVVDEDAFLNGVKINGKLIVAKGVLVEEDMRLSGKLETETLKAKRIKMTGKILVPGAIVASEMIAKSKNYNEIGSLQVDDLQLITREQDFPGAEDSHFILDIIRSVIEPFMDLGSDKYGSFHVLGDITGKNIVIQDTVVDGDVHAEKVELLGDTEVKGVVYYTESYVADETCVVNKVVKVDNHDDLKSKV